MKIGIAGPLNVQSLKLDEYNGDLPHCYSFPMYSLFINSLIAKGHSVTAITLSRETQNIKIIETNSIKLYIIPRKKSAGRRFFTYERKAIVEIINSSNLDIVHALWSYEFAWAALNSNTRTIVTLQDHSYTMLKFQFDFFRMVRYIMNQIVLKKAQYLICNSQYLFDLLNVANKRKARIISNFYSKDLEKYYSAYAKKENYLISICNGFGKRKNVQKSILAFSILRKKYKDLSYRIIGTQMGISGRAYEFANQRKIEDGIEFIGRIPFNEVIEHIKGAKALIHPSLEESFGMAVLEPMIIGTPVIGGKKSGNVPYLLQNNLTGLTCDVTDPQSIAESAMKLLDNIDLASSISKNAFKFVIQNFNEEHIVNQHINYYDFVTQDSKNSVVS